MGIMSVIFIPIVILISIFLLMVFACVGAILEKPELTAKILNVVAKLFQLAILAFMLIGFIVVIALGIFSI
ncbi:hypothetical protein LCM23_06420 [Cytobacillus kochii]|uniref:hypothetical protein n=1 Tax=Cytobacillus kochii TaxID=859143 RepID=UPI001CD2D0B0|nr:hypothetical protein [Cytobacillus kochii]MCA1025720.1 hypothetical protein [Cytobacillus kochii]